MITQNEIDKNYVDSVEAGKLLNITDARIRKLCLDGRFAGALKTGKSWLIPKQSVENFTRLPPGKKPRKNKNEAFIKEALKNFQESEKKIKCQDGSKKTEAN